MLISISCCFDKLFQICRFYSVKFGSHYKIVKKYLEILPGKIMEFCEPGKVGTLSKDPSSLQ